MNKEFYGSKSVTTVPVRISGDDTVVYRLLRGYMPEIDGDIYSLLVSLYENGELTDETYAFDICRDTERAEALFDLTVKYEVLPSSFADTFEYMLDLL